MNETILANGSDISYSRPRVMGIVNCTPDSFAVKYPTTDSAVACALRMINEGADILDIGGESSRPGSEPVSAETETARVLPVIEAIRERSNIPLSIDTTKAVVARRALEAGADIINDISALAFDSDMAAVAAEFRCPVVLMHINGVPKTMQEAPHFDDVVKDVNDYFAQRIDFAMTHGIDKRGLILDIGIGFGKRRVDNLMLLQRLSEFTAFDLPLLVGASRKRFIGDITGAAVEDRLAGSVGIAALAVAAGANIVRVHDVAETRQAALIAHAMREV